MQLALPNSFALGRATSGYCQQPLSCWSLGWPGHAHLCHLPAPCAGRDQRRVKRLLSRALLSVSFTLLCKVCVCIRPEGNRKSEAELLIQGCLIRKMALDLEGAILTSIF